MVETTIITAGCCLTRLFSTKKHTHTTHHFNGLFFRSTWISQFPLYAPIILILRISWKRSQLFVPTRFFSSYSSAMLCYVNCHDGILKGFKEELFTGRVPFKATNSIKALKALVNQLIFHWLFFSVCTASLAASHEVLLHSSHSLRIVRAGQLNCHPMTSHSLSTKYNNNTIFSFC